jgi:hypothetical protein
MVKQMANVAAELINGIILTVTPAARQSKVIRSCFVRLAQALPSLVLAAKHFCWSWLLTSRAALNAIPFSRTDSLPINHPAESILTMLKQVARAQAMFSAQAMFPAQASGEDSAIIASSIPSLWYLRSGTFALFSPGSCVFFSFEATERNPQAPKFA